MNKFLGLVCVLGIGLSAAAQEQVLPRFAVQAARQQASVQQRLNEIAAQTAAHRRQPNMTVERVVEQVERTGAANACLLLAITSDQAYVNSLDEQQLGELAEAFAYVQAGNGPGCGMPLLRAVTAVLEKAPNDEHPVHLFYGTALLILAQHPQLQIAAYQWALEQVELASRRDADGYGGVWAAVVLEALSEQENPLFSRRQFENWLVETIAKFDWLKDARADYFLGRIKSTNAFHENNQTILLPLFAQANSFFAMKDDSSFLKSFVSTGGLNEIGRKKGTQRFSSDGEIFYFHNFTPGTDGRGHFVASANGRKHHIVAELVWALFISYAQQERAAASAQMTEFVRSYLTTNSKGEFEHYLYIPLQAMRAGREVLDGSSLYGWEREEQALQQELADKLKKGYGLLVAVTAVQGVEEVALEWTGVGLVFRGIGIGAKAIGKGIGKVWVKHMPKRARVFLRKNSVERGYKLVGKNYKVVKHGRWVREATEKDL